MCDFLGSRAIEGTEGMAETKGTKGTDGTMENLDIDEAGLGHQSLHLGAEQRPEGAHELARCRRFMYMYMYISQTYVCMYITLKVHTNFPKP